MTQHFTRNTVEAESWCRKCGKPTMHRIDGVKLGPCLDCLRALENPPLPGIIEPQPEQLTIENTYGTIEIK